MAQVDFEKLLSGEGIAQDAVPEGEYVVKVLDARSHAGKGNGTVFLDLEVQEGPLRGSMTQVTLYLPDGSGANARGAAFHFAKKMVGFNLGPELGRAMNGGEPAAILAEALVDKVVSAELDVQSGGKYAGSNNLLRTKPVDGVPTPPAQNVPTATAEYAPKADDSADDALPF